MPTTPTTHVLYLHGFRSTPQSTKARLVGERMARDWPHIVFHCPQLPPSPRQAMEAVMRDITHWPRRPAQGPATAGMAVIGSSLGGFYATWIAEQTGCRAVVLNPAVHAARDLSTQVGEHTSWHDPQEKFVFKPEYVEELRALAVPAITRPERYYALIAKGDEVLDWQEMLAHYANPYGRLQHGHLLEGSDHAISDFPDHLDEVVAFLNLAPKT
jgi:predicted esterase YcpF (UPF0227 family)